MGKRRSAIVAELSVEPVTLATGVPLRTARTTVQRWRRVADPLNHGWLPAGADIRRSGLCPKEELE